MGFGSYKTAWCWPHKLRAAMLRSDSEPLGPFVQIDEALVGGKGGPNKELVLVAAEAGGRVWLAHIENNDEGTVKRFADGQIAADAHVVTDGHAGYDAKSLGKRPHDAVVQTKAERRENDAVQGCHWTIPLLKRWLIGTHAGAVRDKHLQGYLDEFAFRHIVGGAMALVCSVGLRAFPSLGVGPPFIILVVTGVVSKPSLRTRAPRWPHHPRKGGDPRRRACWAAFRQLGYRRYKRYIHCSSGLSCNAHELL
jgi:hypothetical protein